MQFLAAPAIGWGAFVANPEQLVLLALREIDSAQTAKIAAFVRPILKAQNKCMKREGQPLESDRENIAELERRVVEFVAERHPTLVKLKVVEA